MRRHGAFFAKLDKPLAAVAGNHDVIYETPSWPGGGGYLGASSATQEAKLKLFRETFGLAEHLLQPDDRWLLADLPLNGSRELCHRDERTATRLAAR